MSRLAGVFYFDFRPVLAAGPFANGGGPLFTAPGVAMIRGTVSPAGNACAVDGRLDDGGAGSGAECPAATLAAAYERSGVAGLRPLVGDWSAALWDAGRRSVVLASDYAGIRPLYFCREAGRLLWSSSLAELVRWSGASRLDEQYAGRFLLRGSVAFRTPYAGIEPVTPGEAVAISAEGIRRERFWDVPADRDVRLRADADYEERLLELFREGVAARVRGHARVAAEVSGGLDSSSVASMAARLGTDLTTFSYTDAETAEDKFFSLVERYCGRPAVHLPLSDLAFAAPDQTGGAAPAYWEPRYRGLAAQLNRLGATALLTGQFGDFAMGNLQDDSDQVARYLRRGHLGAAGREAYAWSQALRVPIYPILWRALRLAFSQWTPGLTEELSPVMLTSPAASDSLSPTLRPRLEPPDSRRELSWRSAPPECRRRFRALAEMLQARTLQTPEALLPFAYAHPFAHRPLVEFAMSIPPGQLCRPGEPRRLMRRAFAGLLPEPVLKRRSKGDYGPVFRRALVPMAHAMLRDVKGIRIVEMGFADRESLVARLERYTQGLECNEAQLRHMILFEFWVREAW